MRKTIATTALVGAVLSLLLIGSVLAEGNGPKTGEIWICPSVSTNNPNGMWVVGGHGAYYILKPGTASHIWQGDPNNPMDDILNPTENLGNHAPHVEDLAQIPAGWALYKDVYPDGIFQGMAMVLPDGAEVFGLDPGPQYIEASQGIPTASAAFW